MSLLSIRYSTVPPGPADNNREASAFAVIRYGANSSHISPVTDGLLNIDVAMPVLGEQQHIFEIWRSDRPMQQEQAGALQLLHNDVFMFGALQVNEAVNLEQATQEGYALILEHLEKQGYPYPLRMWNYLPEILALEDGMERYQFFCTGRHTALATEPDYETRLPAASALGTTGTGFIIYFIAAREPPQQIENPLQVSAFHYPTCYSPKSPSFSRATIQNLPDCTQFYLSGTASIRGHESRGEENIQNQLQLTLDNIEHLLTHAREHFPIVEDRIDNLTLLKIYLRREKDYAPVREYMQQRFGKDYPLLYLQADICRKELLIEIEGWGTFANSR